MIFVFSFGLRCLIGCIIAFKTPKKQYKINGFFKFSYFDKRITNLLSGITNAPISQVQTAQIVALHKNFFIFCETLLKFLFHALLPLKPMHNHICKFQGCACAALAGYTLCLLFLKGAMGAAQLKSSEHGILLPDRSGPSVYLFVWDFSHKKHPICSVVYHTNQQMGCSLNFHFDSAGLISTYRPCQEPVRREQRVPARRQPGSRWSAPLQPRWQRSPEQNG